MRFSQNKPSDLVKQVKLHALEQGKKLKDAVADLLRIGLTARASAPSRPDALMLKRRRAMTRKFVSGEWGVELAGYEKARVADRRKAAERAKAWRE